MLQLFLCETLSIIVPIVYGLCLDYVSIPQHLNFHNRMHTIIKCFQTIFFVFIFLSMCLKEGIRYHQK